MSLPLPLLTVTGGNVCASWEEVNVVTPTSPSSTNFGWPLCEGNCGNPNFPNCPCSAGYTNPWYSYPHDCTLPHGAAVMGGFVYRGQMFPAQYQGGYFYAEYSRGQLFFLAIDGNNKPVVPAVLFDTPYSVIFLTQGPNVSVLHAWV